MKHQLVGPTLESGALAKAHVGQLGRRPVPSRAFTPVVEVSPVRTQVWSRSHRNARRMHAAKQVILF